MIVGTTMSATDPTPIVYPEILEDFTPPPALLAPCSVLVGTAGTGKTYLAREWAAHDASIWLCATTGIAAVNLNTVTINSTLWYFDTDDLEQQYHLGRIQAALRKLRASRYTRLVVDEFSMMDGRQLDLLCFALDEVNVGMDEKPMSITLVGDPCQLPPVKAQFAFERPAWERFKDNIVTLTEPRRQADPDFVHALQAVRRGDATEGLRYFRPCLDPREDMKFRGTTIVSKNDEVERVNRVRLMDLKGSLVTYPSWREGKQRSEWKHLPEQLELKPGAIVMCLANRYEAGMLVCANGDLAEFIERVETDPVMEERGPFARVKLLRNDAVVLIPRVTRKNEQVTGATGDKKARKEVVGSITFMPLRLAFASTVHKVQGLSLDHVQLLMHNAFWMQPSMTYVGLSRARTVGGLRIICTEKQFAARVTVDPRVRGWI
jgi:ATP-dependent DNA helicase PIF1